MAACSKLFPIRKKRGKILRPKGGGSSVVATISAMFSGIVEGLKTVVFLRAEQASMSVGVELLDLAKGVREGDSVAIDGCCLTVEALAGSVARFHVIGETLRLTTLGGLREGSRVNVERSLKIGDPLGGHFVTGHVDGVGAVVEKRQGPDQTWMSVDLPGPLAELVLYKGSIALDGVSLTVAGLDRTRVSVALIPHTLEHTTLGAREPGTKVNVECDMIGKWVKRLLPGLDR
jgi:riboflavin synthase